MESEIQALIYKSRAMAQNRELSSSFDNTNIEVIIASTIDEDSVGDNVSGERINNNFRYPINSDGGATGTVIEKEETYRNTLMVNSIMNLAIYMVTPMNQLLY